MAIHLGLVAVTKCPEFTLESDDAKQLGEATAAVLAHYKVKMTPKQEAYALLLEAAAKVYPPMLVSIYVRKKLEAEEKARLKPVPPKPTAPPPGPVKSAPNITPIRPGDFNPTDIRIPDGG